MNKLILFSTLLLAGRLGAQCPYFVACQSDSLYCDYSTNDSLLWKAAPYTWNSSLMLADLPEGDVALRMVARDSCGGQDIVVEYTLFLDLDGNDTAETVVRSNALPPIGKVLFNNILSPNYALGDTIAFDLRSGLPDSMLFRFGLEIQHLGDSVVAQLMWTTDITNLNFSAPKLPLGKHRIRWRIEQGGVERFCEYGFVVKDCAPPVVGCVTIKYIDLGFSVYQGYATIEAADFVVSASDNITPLSFLEYGIRLAGTGIIGFPKDSSGNSIHSYTFSCKEAFDTWPVEIWAKDRAGNSNYCVSTVSVDESSGLYCGDPTYLVVCSSTEVNNPIENVTITIKSNSFGPQFEEIGTSNNFGCVGFVGDISCPSDFGIVPIRNDNPLNGVTTYDLVLISKHILGLESFNSPYKMIAADANKSGSITTFDIVELRKLILGIYNTLADNSSWRFVPKQFIFPNPQNPFQSDFQDSLAVDDWQCFPIGFEFTGIKVGDVNNTAVPNVTTEPPLKDRSPSFLALPDVEFQAGETFEIPINATENADLLGIQFSLDFDPEMLEIEAIESSVLPDFDQKNWAQPQVGRLNLSWSAASVTNISTETAIFNLRVRARKALRLSSILKMPEMPRFHSEAYDSEGLARPLQIVFSENSPMETAQIFAPQPNPTTAGATLPIQLLQAENLRLEVRDLSGKLLWVKEYLLEKGSHVLEIPALAMPHAGMYVWCAQGGGVLKSGKITKA
jgi:Cohesin domain